MARTIASCRRGSAGVSEPATVRDAPLYTPPRTGTFRTPLTTNGMLELDSRHATAAAPLFSRLCRVDQVGPDSESTSLRLHLAGARRPATAVMRMHLYSYRAALDAASTCACINLKIAISWRGAAPPAPAARESISCMISYTLVVIWAMSWALGTYHLASLGVLGHLRQAGRRRGWPGTGEVGGATRWGRRDGRARGRDLLMR
eukprot:SAG22_NODE_2188_length_2865_cov_5.442878_5_plen_203_part_00